MYHPQQPFVEPGMFGQPPMSEGMFAQPPGMFPPNAGFYPQQPSPFPGMGQKGFPQMPFDGSLIGEAQYNLDARLDRIEREILELNRRLNTMTRQIRRIENFLNIREG